MTNNKGNEVLDKDVINNKLPNLILTPFFENNSAWPSYYIKPIYTDTTQVDQSLSAYYNTVNNLSNNIQTQSHTSHTNNGFTYMYPTMPYYITTQNGSETIPQVFSQPQNTLRQQQLWYYQQYIPTNYNSVV